MEAVNLFLSILVSLVTLGGALAGVMLYFHKQANSKALSLHKSALEKISSLSSDMDTLKASVAKVQSDLFKIDKGMLKAGDKRINSFFEVLENSYEHSRKHQAKRQEELEASIDGVKVQVKEHTGRIIDLDKIGKNHKRWIAHLKNSFDKHEQLIKKGKPDG